MQREYAGWSLRCLFVVGAHAGGGEYGYRADPTCPELALRADDTYLGLGHKVKAMLVWIAAHVEAYDYLLKTDVDTLICFSAVTDMIDAARRRYGGDERMYLGHYDTCSKIQHNPGERFHDPAYMADLLDRTDAACYPPYMQGLGYVLSSDLVSLLAAVAPTLKVRGSSPQSGFPHRGVAVSPQRPLQTPREQTLCVAVDQSRVGCVLAACGLT